MRATKIRMKNGCFYSNNLTEIDEIYIEGCTTPGFYKKSDIHDHLKKYPGSIHVNIYPYPDIVPASSVYGEKYVRSTPNTSQKDNLLALPRV